MKYKTYDAILNGYEAESDQEAIDYARGMVWSEVDTTEQSIAYARYIDSVEGVSIYYNYASDHYFFCDDED